MSSNYRQITGRQIAAARNLLKVTQVELATTLGTHAESLQRIEASERGRRRVSRLFIALVRELERRGIEFINGTGVKLKDPAQDGTARHESASR